MLSIETPSPDPSSCPCEISQLNTSSTDDQQLSGVLQSDLLISCPSFTIRDYAFSIRSKDIKTSWPFSEKSLQLCLNHGVKDLLPPFQSFGAVKKPAVQRSTNATSHIIDQASRKTNLLLSVTSVEAETLLNYSASKPIKKLSLVDNKVKNLMKPVTKKCREIPKLNNAASDQNKLDYNTSNNLFVSETMASKVCPVCKTFTSSSNTTLNAHIDQCLSGVSVRQWTSDPKVTKSRIKPRRMRSMVDIYATAQHCTIEDLERRNGTNLASCLSLPAQDMEVGSVERKRKSPVDFEEPENEAAVCAKGTNSRILSKLNDLSSPVMAGDDTGTCKHVDGEKGTKLCLAKMKKKKLREKHHKLQINSIHEHSRGPEEHLEVDEAFTKPQRAPGLTEYIESKCVGRRIFSKRSVLTKMNGEGYHPHPTSCTREKILAGVNDVESPQYSYVNKGCGSKINKSSGTPHASPRSSEPHNDYGRVLSLRRSVRAPLGFEPCHDRNNPLGEGNRKELNKSDSSVKCKNKDEIGNKLIPMASLSIRKVKMKRSLTRNASSVGDNSKDFPDGHDMSSNSRGFSSFTQKQTSILSSPQALAPESTLGPKSKRLDLKRPHVYCESESGGADIVRQSIAKLSDHVTMDRRELKVKRDGGKTKVSGKGKALVFKGMKSTIEHPEPQVDGINDSYSDNATASVDNEKESEQFTVQRCQKVVVDEVTCNNPFFEASKGLCKPTIEHPEPQVDGINDSYSDNATASLGNKKESEQFNVQCCEKAVVDEVTCNNPFFETSKGLCKSTNVQCHEVAGHVDVLSDSRGYIKFCDEKIGTEDANYPVESILNGGEKMFYMDEEGKTIFDQNVHATTELHTNDGSGCYYAEVDLIPIPGPPGSFLPSPSSNEFHGNSTPISSQDRSSENYHEFAGRDSLDSPSPTSTISNSDIAKFDSSLIERLPFRHRIQDVMRSSVYGTTGNFMVDEISLDPSAAFAGGGVLDTVEPKVHLTETPLGIKNDQPCHCSKKDGAVLSSAVFSYQDTSLLSGPSMPSVPESPFNTQMKSDETRRATDCNLMLNVPYSNSVAQEIRNSTGVQLGLIPHKPCTNSGIKFFNTDGESASPSTSNSFFRLMGKDLMVVNKDEIYPHQTAKETNFIDDQNRVDLATRGMGVLSHRVPSKQELMASCVVSPGNSNSMYSFPPETSHDGSLPPTQTASFQVPNMTRVNSSFPIKWNCVTQSSNLIPRGSFPSSPSSAHHHMLSTTYQSGDFS